MNYPKPDILEKKDIQVQARYFFVPEYSGKIPQDFFPATRQNASRALERFSGIEGFDNFEGFDDTEPLTPAQRRGSPVRSFSAQDFPPADNDTIVLRIENSSGIRQPVELFKASDNALSSNFGNKSEIFVTSTTGVKSYAEIMMQATNTQFWIGMIRAEVVSGADPRDFFSSPIRFVETDAMGGSRSQPLFQRPTNFQLHREIIDTNVRGVKINPFTSMIVDMPPHTIIVLTIFKEPNPQAEQQFAQPSFANPIQLSPAALAALRGEEESVFAQPSFQVLGIDEAADINLMAKLKAKAAARRQERLAARLDKKAAKMEAREAKVQGRMAIREKFNIWPSKNPHNFDEDNG